MAGTYVDLLRRWKIYMFFYMGNTPAVHRKYSFMCRDRMYLMARERVGHQPAALHF